MIIRNLPNTKSILLMCTCVVGIFESCYTNYIRFFGVVPDALLIIVVISALVTEKKFAYSLAFVCGLLRDATTAHGFGIYTVMFIIWVSLVIYVNRKISLEDSLVRVASIGVISFIQACCLWLMMLWKKEYIPVGIIMRIIFLSTLYTSGLAFAGRSLIRKLISSKIIQIQS